MEQALGDVMAVALVPALTALSTPSLTVDFSALVAPKLRP